MIKETFQTDDSPNDYTQNAPKKGPQGSLAGRRVLSYDIIQKAKIPTKIQDTIPQISRQKSHFIPPVLIQSPRIRNNFLDEIDEIQPSCFSDEIQPSALENQIVSENKPQSFTSPLDLTQKIASNYDFRYHTPRSPVLVAPSEICPTPSKTLLEAKIREAQENYKQSRSAWELRISEEKNDLQAEMRMLLEQHKKEMKELERVIGSPPKGMTSPLKIEAVFEDTTIYKVKTHKATTIGSPEANSKRKALIGRQKKQIMNLDKEYEVRMEKLQERMERDLKIHQQRIQSMIEEYHANGGQIKFNLEGELHMPPRAATTTPKPRPGRIIRLALKTTPI